MAAPRKQQGVVFVDTRPAVTEPEAEAARVADLVIVPVRPSPDDLEAVGETLKILRRLNKPAVLVVNAAKNEVRARDARAALSRYPCRCAQPTLPTALFIWMRRWKDAASRDAGRLLPATLSQSFNRYGPGF